MVKTKERSYNASQLKTTARCNRHRSLNGLENSDLKTNVYYETSIKKKALTDAIYRRSRELLNCKKNKVPYTYQMMNDLKADVFKFLDTEFSALEYPNETTRIMRRDDAFKQVWRYIKSENRFPQFWPAKDLEIFSMKVTNIKPDAVFIDRTARTMEGVIYKAKRPDMYQSSEAEDKSPLRSMELYAIIKYLETQIPMGEEWQLKASYYFLRKNAQTDTSKEFDPDFFTLNEKGDGYTGGNIVSLEMSTSSIPSYDGCLYSSLDDKEKPCCMSNGKQDKTACPYMAVCSSVYGKGQTEIDDVFEPQFTEFLIGKENDECDETQCKNCEHNHICHYTQAPKVLESNNNNESTWSNITLSPAQEQIVNFSKGIGKCNAGAGAGKTFVMSYRAAKLIDEGCDPSKICILTFSKSAADEITGRVKKWCDQMLVEADVDTLVSTTFNSFGNAIIAEYYEELGFMREPIVISQPTRMSILADILNREDIIKQLMDGLDYKNFDSSTQTCMGALAMTSLMCDLFKRYDIGKGDIKLKSKFLKSKMPYAVQSKVTVQTLELVYDTVYTEFDEYLRSNSFIEFADQESLLFELLQTNPTLFEQFGFEHIVVDEFQDTSETQIEIIKELMNNPSFKSLLVVGDDAQAIYGFRDTTPEYIINFSKYIGRPVTEFYLLDNYRSQAKIIDLANSIIELNNNRVIKSLVAKKTAGKDVIVRGFHWDIEMYQYIYDTIKARIDEGREYEEICFIGSDANELKKVGSFLSEHDIPWIMLNPEKLIENSRIIAAINLAKFYKQPNAVNSARIYLNAVLNNTLFDSSVDEINQMVEGLQSEICMLHSESKKNQLNGFYNLLKDIKTDDEIYLDFMDSLKHFSTLDDILKYMSDLDNYGGNESKRRLLKYPGVVLTTAHSSKGLEWPIVINSIDKYDKKDLKKTEDIEEKRRLFFVSITRAKEELYIVSKYGVNQNKSVYNRFLKEAYEKAGYEFAPGEATPKPNTNGNISASSLAVRELLKKRKERADELKAAEKIRKEVAKKAEKEKEKEAKKAKKATEKSEKNKTKVANS